MDTEMGTSSAAAAATSVCRPADRRALYRRSNTLSSLPLDALQAAASSSGTERRRPLEPILDSPVREAGATTDEVTPKDGRTRPQIAGRTAVPRQGKISDSGVGRRAQLCRKTSCNDLLLTANTSGARPLYPATATSGLVGGSSGRLLTKVKERIRDTVLQTTPEWPAVMQERRQRAAIQFEMRAAKMIADEQRTTAETATVNNRAGSKCAEQKSFASTVVDGKETARTAFRQNRSASCEDTVTTTVGETLYPESSATVGKTGRRERRGSPNSDTTEIICSSKDFRSIIEHIQQKVVSDETPTSFVHTTSVDNADNGTSPSPSTVVVPDKLNSEGRQRRTGDKNNESVTVEIHVACSDTAAGTSVSEAKPVDKDRYLPLGTNRSDDLPRTSLHDSEIATVDEVTSDCRAASPTQPPKLIHDADGQTRGIYGAELDPAVLGDAIQRHLQSIMLTASSISGMRPQVRTPSKHNDVVSATAATGKPGKSSDNCQTECRRNFIQRFIRSLTKRRRSLTNQSSSK